MNAATAPLSTLDTYVQPAEQQRVHFGARLRTRLGVRHAAHAPRNFTLACLARLAKISARQERATLESPQIADTSDAAQFQLNAHCAQPRAPTNSAAELNYLTAPPLHSDELVARRMRTPAVRTKAGGQAKRAR